MCDSHSDPDDECKGEDGRVVGKQKLSHSVIDPVPFEEMDHTKFSNFTTKGIFSQYCLLAALDSSSSQQSISTSSSSLKIIQEHVIISKKSKASILTTGSDMNSLKTVRIDDVGAGSENFSLLLPNSSFSPQEMVFSIDHILESIFLKFDQQTLLSCRLVSRRWAHFGSKALQEIVKIQFDPAVDLKNGTGPLPHFRCKNNSHRSIEDLATLMNNSTEFPSNFFSFVSGHFAGIHPSVFQFLGAHGERITKLEFNSGLMCLHDMIRLLLTDVTKLEQLLLENVLVHTSKLGAEKSEIVPPEKQAERIQSLFEEYFTGPKRVLKNLKVLKCNSDLPEQLIQQLLKYSPNLVEVYLRVPYLHCLVKPANRLHLLKKLEITSNNVNSESLNLVANHHEGNLGVEVLSFSSLDIDQNDQQNAVDLICKIVQGCSSSCQQLYFCEFEFGMIFKIPLMPMPQVKHLSIQFDEIYFQIYPFSAPYFTRDSSMGDLFPNLHHFKLNAGDLFQESIFEDVFGDEKPAPVLSVKEVSLCSLDNNEILAEFRRIFPNATVVKTEVHEEDGWWMNLP